MNGGDPLWGEATEHAIAAFPVSGRRMPRVFLRSVVEIKRAAALVNEELGHIDAARADAIVAACDEILAERHPRQFPVDVYQTGSGTSSNMNVNEVVATIASRRCGLEVLPHEHVNRGQSSNDVVPSAMRIAFLLAIDRTLGPALDRFSASLSEKADEFWDVLKVARTHWQDATPMRLGQEFWGWADQVSAARTRVDVAADELRALPLGGTAVGTGVGTVPGFGARVGKRVAERVGVSLSETENHFWAQNTLDAAISAHAAVRTAALALHKIVCDIRLLATGPRAGLGEIRVPDVRVSSSIMPGKVPPSVIESLTMTVARVVGNDATIGFAQTGSILELNVMMPVVIEAFLESIDLLAAATENVAQQCIAGIEATEAGPEQVRSSVMLTTALVPHIGHHAATRITEEALVTGEAIDVVAERHGVSAEAFHAWVDPTRMTGAGDERPWHRHVAAVKH